MGRNSKSGRGCETLASVGEDGLIRRIAGWTRGAVCGGFGSGRPAWAELDVLRDTGDDAAVVRSKAAGAGTVLTADMLVEGVHFLSDHPPGDLGYKALTSNLSDLAAMGAWPTWFLVSLGAPGDTPVGWVRSLYGGMSTAACPWGALCLGGDSVRSDSLTVSISAGGASCPGGGLLRRDAARAGMSLYVTGTLGDSGAGLWLLQHPRRRPRKAGLRGDVARLIAAHRRPEARVGAGVALGRLCPGASAMDLSDGLARDLARMAAASACGFDIDLAALPVSRELERVAGWAGESARGFAWGGGEDYELLFATDVSEDIWRPEVEKGVGVTRIGMAREGAGVRWVGEGGVEVECGLAGFEHFAV